MSSSTETQFSHDSTRDTEAPDFCFAYAVLDLVGGCDVCATKEGWGTMISLPNSPPFLVVCKKHARSLLGMLLTRFLLVRGGDKPEVIDTTPFPRGVAKEVAVEEETE